MTKIYELPQPGEIFGAKKVISRVRPAGKGTKTSYWEFECLKCGEISTTTLTVIKARKDCCVKCLYKNRLYQDQELPCNYCGKLLIVNNKMHTAYCNSICKRESAYGRARASRRADVEGTLKALATQIKSRSKKKGFTCSIDAAYLIRMLRKQKGLCARTGVELQPSSKAGELRQADPMTVSVDRKDSSRGYIRGNIELVSMVFNTAKNRHDYKEIEQMCVNFLEFSCGYKCVKKDD